MSDVTKISEAFQAGERPHAIRLSRKLVLDCDSATMTELSEVLINQGAFSAAVDIWDRRRNSGVIDLRENPAFVVALNHLALEHADENRCDEAIRLLDRALEIEAQDIRSRRNLASVLLLTGDFEVALAELDEVLSADPADPESNELLGIARYQSGDPALASEPLQLAAAGGSANASLWLAKALCLEDKLDSAAETLQGLLNASPDRAPHMIQAELSEPGSPLNRLYDHAAGAALIESLDA
ncbi:MAG: tetratricopeptide repeat protein [Planctomycetota bacterium]|jgi:tetratricopeptide (TPR) repeat protein